MIDDTVSAAGLNALLTICQKQTNKQMNYQMPNCR